MLLNEAISEIKTLLGFRSDLDEQIKSQLTRAQEYFQRGPVYPWFLLSEDATTTTSVGAQRVQLPGDFLSEFEDGALFYIPSNTELEEVALTKETYEQLMEEFERGAEGPPEGYCITGFYFRIFPIPDEEYTLRMMYYQKDTPISNLSTADTCLWLTHAPNCLIGHAGKKLASTVGNANALAVFKEMESSAIVQLNTENEARNMTNRELLMGGPAA